jgi:hypothetical protein
MTDPPFTLQPAGEQFVIAGQFGDQFCWIAGSFAFRSHARTEVISTLGWCDSDQAAVRTVMHACPVLYHHRFTEVVAGAEDEAVGEVAKLARRALADRH